jgi:hypothetical protein
MDTKADKPFFLTKNEGLGQAKPEDDLLHPEQNKLVMHESLTETQYFGFSIPEEKIHAIGYMWHHPNLHVVSGGVVVFQGFKVLQIAAELSDVRIFMSDDVLKDNLHDYRLANGYGVKVVEPLKRHHMTYSDPARKNAVDIHYEALQPPVMYGNGKHFEQALHARGELVLRGKRYEVDCFNVRDRSWAKPRQEDHMPLPPGSWMTGVFNKDFSFNCNILEQVQHNPELKGHFDLPPENTVLGGWIQRDGKVSHIVRGTKRTTGRDPHTYLPKSIEFEVTDDLGRTIQVRGTLVAGCPMTVWPNIYFPLCLARWECEGMVAYGDFQEGIWNDYANLVSGQP